MFTLKQQVPIISPRLLLRSFVTSDIATIAMLANDREIADNTLNIPYPYSEDDARLWLELQAQQTQCGDSYSWAITLQDTGALIGAISLTLLQEQQAETGYWIGREFRNQGYCSEALQALIRVAAETYHLTSISAVHLRSNPASGCVMRHAGMHHLTEEQRPDSQGNWVPVEIYSLELASR
ncbi:GNAT family N-acetyltransferase [Shewanella dokdonensis]|uniref:GNAT family N-acetyltransferase n=1 Tax=Shewanella dokdonensis TaxID=712036 RepID=A0ABX8DHX3_9GAMM|nr:GNAT family N-acetyltransferase [Shewanella dokdonensis]MCL1074975.1 GNAT family N-acetyltransferase [Shewanella dokdonensis]QVK23407.1 GNAT family N-acetyltransferase [Shewanella dokdonensis]